MKKAVLTLLVLVVIASGCSSTAPADTGNPDQGQDQSPTDTGSSDGSEGSVAATVTYTDQGFQPSQVSISTGDTVRWVDEASNDMWVASDEHPRHTNYAGTSRSEHCAGETNTAFDQCSRGDTYSFTFEKEGTWDYHNHVAASDGGTVVVE